jgi:hypothetical protein
MINRITYSVVLTIVIASLVFVTPTIQQQHSYAQIPGLTTSPPSTSQD